MKISNVISGVASTLFVAAILAFGLSTVIPSAAEAQAEPQCKGPKADRPSPECDGNSGGHVHVPLVATHESALGHALDCLVCGEAPFEDGSGNTISGPGCASGDIFDVGTSHDGMLVCELLQCNVGSDGVGCSSNFEDGPQPLIDIGGGTTATPATLTGLFGLWDGWIR